MPRPTMNKQRNASRANRLWLMMPTFWLCACAAPSTIPATASESLTNRSAPTLLAASIRDARCYDCLKPTLKTFPVQAIALTAAPVPVAASPVDLQLSQVPSPKPTAISALQSRVLTLHHDNGRAVSKQTMGQLLNGLSENDRNRQIVITGYADNSGNAQGNARLAIRRALVAKTALVNQGFTAQQIIIKAAPFEFSAPNSSAEGRALNRRTTIVFI